MKAEIITIGDELLIGQVIDTNSAWMAQRLNEIGIDVIQKTCISDESEQILKTLYEASQRADIILITGGLGPTSDDITKPTLCRFFETDLILNQSVLQNIENLLRSRGVPLIEPNRLQAMVPANCTVLQNKLGTAPGMWFEKGGKIFLSMPGVPFEMQGIMANEVLPRLKSKSGSYIIHKSLLVTGMAESVLSQKLQNWESQFPENIKLAYLPSPGQIKLRLTGKGNNESQLQAEIKKLTDALFEVIPQAMEQKQDGGIENSIAELFISKNATLSLAESCTGGNIARLITSVAGCSRFFKGSVVSYSNEMKINILKVNPTIIDQYGAVSQQVVEQMAAGIKNLTGSDYAVATSGIAGPDGGTAEKPVGTVWIAVATPNEIYSQKFVFGDNRERNITRASIAALDFLRKNII